MHLILGSAADTCCAQVSQALANRGHEVRIVDSLFSESHLISWRFGGGTLGKGLSKIGAASEWQTKSTEIESVLVRDSGLSSVAGWSEADAHYMSTEMQAALLAWLWSLPCVVVNRLPASLFLTPRPSFLQWIPLLTHAGLDVPSAVISNDRDQIMNWRMRQANGAVLAPVSSQARFELRTDSEWESVLRVANYAPVALQQAHGRPHLACVIGDAVIWNSINNTTLSKLHQLEPALLQFAKSAGLNFVEVAIAERSIISSGEICYQVVDVDINVDIRRYTSTQQNQLIHALTNLLTARVSPTQATESVSAATLAGGAR